MDTKIKHGYKRYLDPQSKEDVPRKTKYRKRIEGHKGELKREENEKIINLNLVQCQLILLAILVFNYFNYWCIEKEIRIYLYIYIFAHIYRLIK